MAGATPPTWHVLQVCYAWHYQIHKQQQQKQLGSSPRVLHQLAVYNARYTFLLVDIGDSGKQSDGRFCNNSHLGQAIDNKLLDIPKPEKINPDSSKLCSFVFVADYAFGLKPHMMKPYPNCTTRTEDIQV